MTSFVNRRIAAALAWAALVFGLSIVAFGLLGALIVTRRPENRLGYDTGRTVDAFSVRLRDEVDLDAVRADLLDAVRTTVQPVHASVWLRESPR